MNLCIIGNRGHLNYVFDDLSHPSLSEMRITGVSSGAPEDDISGLFETCRSLGHDPVIYTDYLEMLDQQKPDIVVVCGPFELHAEMCIQAFQRGAHVFCEKPAAITLRDLDRLREAYTRSGVHFGTMMGLRYDPAFYTAWRRVQAGDIGEVRLLNAQKSYKLGSRPAYYWRRETYGGTIPWVGSHAIDWIAWFSRRDFISVNAVQSRVANGGYGSLEVSALCQFRLSGEVFASASVDYLRPLDASTHGDDRLRVVGTQGVIEVRLGQVFLTNAQNPGSDPLPAACDRSVFSDFVAHVTGKSQCLLTPQEIFLVTEACLLAQQSADENKPIKFRRP